MYIKCSQNKPDIWSKQEYLLCTIQHLESTEAEWPKLSMAASAFCFHQHTIHLRSLNKLFDSFEDNSLP